MGRNLGVDFCGTWLCAQFWCGGTEHMVKGTLFLDVHLCQLVSFSCAWLQWEHWGSLCSAAVAHSPCTQSGLPHALKVLGSWVHLGPELQCQFFVTPPLVTSTASVNGQSLAKILPWPQIYKVMVTAQPSKILGLIYRQQNMTLQDQLL